MFLFNMKQLLTVLLISLLFLLPLSVVSAQKPEDNPSPGIPEQSGDYPDPDHPGLRVRVFVHPAREHAQGPKVVDSASLVCTEDPNSSAFVDWAGWKLPTGNWTYNLNPSSVPGSVNPNNLPTIAANGFNAWQNALTSPSKPNLVRGSDTKVNKSSYDGQNVIAWNRITAQALGITYIRYYPDTHLAVDVDTIMNKLYRWKWSGGGLCAQDDAYDAQNILTHEQGHWYGLDDEYADSYVHNSMYGYGFLGETKKDTLTTGDINGVLAIY